MLCSKIIFNVTEAMNSHEERRQGHPQIHSNEEIEKYLVQYVWKVASN